MMNATKLFVAALIMMPTLVGCSPSSEEDETQTYPLDSLAGLTPNQVAASVAPFDGRTAVQVQITDPEILGNAPTFVLVEGTEGFHDGTIEVEVASTLTPDASEFARGFIGIAFRVAEDLGTFEAMYLRPANGFDETDDPVRRERAVQYFAYPDHPFEVLRETDPGVYEKGADIHLEEWTTMTIEIEGQVGSLYLDGAAEPVLTVQDLKLGPDERGAIALWVDVESVAYFRNLRVTPAD